SFLKTWLLYAPANPLSEVITRYATFLTSRFSSIGCEVSSRLLVILTTTSLIFSLLPIKHLAFCSARDILEAETISIAVVICFVFFVESIRPLISLSDPKTFHHPFRKNQSFPFVGLY